MHPTCLIRIVSNMLTLIAGGICHSRWLKRVLSLRKRSIATVRHAVHSWHPCVGLNGIRCRSFLSSMAKRTAHVPLELDTRGVSLTDFAQAICLQEQLEVSLIRLRITVQQLTFPLCLVAASGLRPQVRPRLGDIPAWTLRQIPNALAQCSVDMPSGLTLWPFADDPRITQEGFILHGSNSEIRAKV